MSKTTKKSKLENLNKPANKSELANKNELANLNNPTKKTKLAKKTKLVRNNVSKKMDHSDDLYPEHRRNYIKVARKWQELLIREMEIYDISGTRVQQESGMSKSVYENFYNAIARPIKIIQLKNTIKHILKQKDLRECENVGKSRCCFPKTESFLNDIKLMDLNMPLGEEEDFIKASSSLDLHNNFRKEISIMEAILKEEGIPPFDEKVGKHKAKEIIRKLTSGDAP